jgi:hypothetical protein
VPNRPTIPGADRFAGKLIHAEDYKGDIASRGTRVLVVGAGSSAHDVAQDLCKLGADVTMLQRSSTCVVSVEPARRARISIYAEDGPPVEDADFVTNSMPFPLLTEFHKELTKRIADMDRDLAEGLRKAGFRAGLRRGRERLPHEISSLRRRLLHQRRLLRVDRRGQDQGQAGRLDRAPGGLFGQVQRRHVDGRRRRRRGGRLHNMSESVRLIMGDKVADRVGPIWGLDDEGEVRAMWRPTGQRGFWLMGAACQQCRPYSKYLALQIKADLVGLSPGRA